MLQYESPIYIYIYIYIYDFLGDFFTFNYIVKQIGL